MRMALQVTSLYIYDYAIIILGYQVMLVQCIWLCEGAIHSLNKKKGAQ